MFPKAPYVTKIISQNIHRSIAKVRAPTSITLEKKIENACLFLRLIERKAYDMFSE